MRPLSRFIVALCVSTALTSCAFFNSSDKPHKNVSASGREDIMLKIAHATEAGGDMGSAERMYKQAVASSPESVEAYLELSDFYKRQQQNEQSINTLNDALRIQPENTTLMREIANSYINMGLPDKALGTLNAAIAINSKDGMLYNSRGVALDMLGQYGEAQKSYDTAAVLAPADIVTVKVNLSMSYILSGNYNKAIELLLPLLDTTDSSPTIRQNLALAYGLKGDKETALKLGLKDLSPKEAEDNLKFYRMLAARHRSDKKLAAESKVAAVDKNNDLLTDEDSEDTKPQKKESAAVTAVTIHDKKIGATSVKPAPAEIKPVTIVPVTTITHEILLPVPVLKPDKAQ